MKYSPANPKFVLPALGFALLFPAAGHCGAIEYGTPSDIYIENFDILADAGGANAWSNGGTVIGWHWVGERGTTPATYMATNGGGAATNRILSLGVTGEADRALGGQNGNDAGTLYYGAKIRNTTGITLDTFTLTYTGEQWRRIQNEAADRLTFQYQIFNPGEGSLSVATGWIAVEALTFVAPNSGTQSSTPLNGNLSANRVEGIGANIPGIIWAPGQEIWLRWADNNPANNSALSLRAQMGIDDVSFSAYRTVTEPAK